jgi:hypothetical protein
MERTPRPVSGRRAAVWGLILALAAPCVILGQSLDIPSKKWGLSFGNSREFSGLRFNFRDGGVRRVTGINVTFWQPRKDNQEALIEGLSLGLIPGGAYLRGIQLGILGVSAEKSATGINIGGLGIGAGENLIGLNIGGIGAGTGGNMTGLNVGGIGVGAGGNMTGINIGGIGAGSGDNVTGINFGGIGIGAGQNLTGITVGGIGAGSGENMTGINIAGLGLGAGKRLSGINLSGFAAGAGERIAGLTICGLAAGAKEINGLTLGGLAVGGEILKGIHLAGGMVHVVKDGRLTGFAASPFNYIRGSQIGLSIGIVNYAFRVNGIQLGLINIVRDNPKYLKVLPVFNTSF